MTDEEPTAAAEDSPTVAAPNAESNQESVLNAVGYLMGTLALVFAAAVVIWMWSIGDLVWPFGSQTLSVPACIPGLDHC